jgi:hypothetical protein
MVGDVAVSNRLLLEFVSFNKPLSFELIQLCFLVLLQLRNHETTTCDAFKCKTSKWFATSFLDDKFKPVTLSYNSIRRIAKEAGTAVGYDVKEFRPYSFCKSAVKWGARCGGQDFDMKNTGRWTTSTSDHFPSYVEEGRSERDIYTNTNQIDRVRYLFMRVQANHLFYTSSFRIITTLEGNNKLLLIYPLNWLLLYHYLQ